MWLAKLKRMMDELPEKYLQANPADPQALMMIPPGSKPVGRIIEEEKRLDGVCRQLWDMALLETDAHRALHGENTSKHPPEACRKHNEDMRNRDQELQIISAILLRSLKERLGFENEYVIDNDDIYAIPNLLDGLQILAQDLSEDQATPDDMSIPGFRGWPETES